MATLLFKVLITAILVVAISEIGKRSTLVGALLASIPLTSLLALVWLYRDTGDALQAATLASGIFWLVLPSLLFFLVFPFGVKWVGDSGQPWARAWPAPSWPTEAWSRLIGDWDSSCSADGGGSTSTESLGSGN